MTPRQTELNKEISQLLAQFQVDAGSIKIKPSFSWLPVAIQVVSLIAVMGWAYGALDGRLRLIEYRLTQIELKVNAAVKP